MDGRKTRDLSKSYLTPDDQHKTQPPSFPNTNDQSTVEPSTKQPSPREDGLNKATQEAMPPHKDDPADTQEAENLTHNEPEQLDNTLLDPHTHHSPPGENVRHDNETADDGDDMTISKHSSSSSESSLSSSGISNVRNINQFSWN